MSDIDLQADLERWPAAWRTDWEIREHHKPMAQAWHRSGLCFFFEFEQIDEDGTWAWVVGDDDISISRFEELRAEMGDEAFTKMWMLLGRQAKVCWQELGYNDWSLRKGASPPR